MPWSSCGKARSSPGFIFKSASSRIYEGKGSFGIDPDQQDPHERQLQPCAAQPSLTLSCDTQIDLRMSALGTETTLIHQIGMAIENRDTGISRFSVDSHHGLASQPSYPSSKGTVALIMDAKK